MVKHRTNSPFLALFATVGLGCIQDQLGLLKGILLMNIAQNMKEPQIARQIRFAETRTLADRQLPRIPTKMLFQAVFMRGGAGPACMDDLVVDQWSADVERRSHLALRCVHREVDYLGHYMSHEIRSAISTACDFP